MAESDGHWITVNGTHIFLKDGQTPDEALRERQIANGKKESRAKRVADAHLDTTAVSEFQSGLDTVLADFGFESDYQFDYKDTESMAAQVLEEDKDTVVYLTSLFKDYDDLYKTRSRNPEGGMSTSMPIFFTGIHEAGHILEHKLTPYGAHSTEMFSREIVQKAQRQVRKAGKSANKSDISRYAAKDNHETIAESMVDWYNNGDNANPLSIAIYKELKNLAKGR